MEPSTLFIQRKGRSAPAIVYFGGVGVMWQAQLNASTANTAAVPDLPGQANSKQPGHSVTHTAELIVV
jgi:hypothetical protein